jgi:hypothetical protein
VRRDHLQRGDERQGAAGVPGAGGPARPMWLRRARGTTAARLFPFLLAGWARWGERAAEGGGCFLG